MHYLSLKPPIDRDPMHRVLAKSSLNQLERAHTPYRPVVDDIKENHTGHVKLLFQYFTKVDRFISELRPNESIIVQPVSDL